MSGQREVIIQVVLRCIAEIIVVSICGIILAYRKILQRQELKKLSMMIEQLFTPALIFSNFILNLNTLDVMSWLPIFICTSIIILVQFIMGYLFNKLVIRDHFYHNMLWVGNGLVNTTGIQLVLVKCLDHQFDVVT